MNRHQTHPAALQELSRHLPPPRAALLGEGWINRRDAWNEGLPGLTAAVLPVDSAASRTPSDDLPAAVRAGLQVMNGRDEAAHAVAQSAEGSADCDYWHGIIHRREPDPANARYWFRRVGTHPAMSPLPAVAADLAQTLTVEPLAGEVLAPTWDPAAFIALCGRAEESPDSDLHLFARALQWAEMRSLMTHVLS